MRGDDGADERKEDQSLLYWMISFILLLLPAKKSKVVTPELPWVKDAKGNTQLVVNEAQDLANILKAGKTGCSCKNCTVTRLVWTNTWRRCSKRRYDVVHIIVPGNIPFNAYLL